MIKLLHRSSAPAASGLAIGAQVGDPDFGELIDRIFDKGMVFDAADRITLADNEQIILGAHQEAS